MTWLYMVIDFLVIALTTAVSGWLAVVAIGTIVFAIMTIADWIKSAST